MHVARDTRTMLAESSVIPWTVTDLQSVSLNVKILAIFVIAFSKLLEKVANWHLGHVVLVKKFTVVSLLAQMSQPVLTDYGAFTSHMAEWTMTASCASTVNVELTQRSFVLYSKATHRHIITHRKST